MKKIMGKLIVIIVAIIISLIIFNSKAFAESSSVEISGEEIIYFEDFDDVSGFYYCKKYLSVGEKFKIKAEQVVYDDAESGKKKEVSRKDVTDTCIWLSSDENIIKVEKGVIEGISEGYAKIMVSYDGKSTLFTVNVGEPIEVGFGEGIYITQKDKIKSIKQGSVLQLDINTIEMTSIKNEEVTWSSSNEQIATVNSKGLVTAIGVGKVTIKAEFKMEHKSYQDTYEIEVTEESKKEFPYDFYIDKKQLNIYVGSSEKLEITAKLKDGYDIIAQYEERIDNWDVTWNVEDEFIAKCTPEKGIVNDIHGVEQIAGRATIQGLKAGNTNLLIKVKIAENQFKEFSIPVTIKEQKEDKKEDQKQDEPKDDKKEEQKKDDTITDKKIPNAGKNNIIIISMILVIFIGLIYFGSKIKSIE